MVANILLYSITVPMIAGILCLFLPDRIKNITRFLSFLVTAISLFSSIYMFMNKPVPYPNGASPLFLVDNLSGFIGIGISVFSFLVTIYSFGFLEKSFGLYFGCLLLTFGASLGAIFANNLIVLLVFWGFLGITLYLLVNTEGNNKASATAKKALIIIGGTDAAMLFGTGFIWLISGTFEMDKIHLPLNGIFPFMAYLLMITASFAKAGAMPFHSWLPDVAEDGPTPVTAYLPASLDKLLGIYLLARVSIDLFIMNDVSNLILLVVGSVTIILAVTFALIQHDLKRLLGYHAVSQVGYMVLGIGTGNPVGIAGGLFHMLNHAVYKACLFLNSGNIEKRTGTTNLSNLGGLAKYMPITFITFLIASLSISGIPPFNGFVSKWMIYQGVIESGNGKNPLWIVWLTCAIFGSALTLASFMKLLHAVFLGRPSKDFKDVKEVGFSMSFPVVTLALICFVFGVFAFMIPLPLFIIPSLKIPITYLGMWHPVVAITLIVIGIILGLLIYYLFRPRSFRTVESFVGGEEPDIFERVSGTEFYDTVKDIKWLNYIYRKEEDKRFDIYDRGTEGTLFFTKILRWLHNGVLPTYMVWCLIGMLFLFLMIIR